MKLVHRALYGVLALAFTLLVFAPVAKATTLLEGDLFYTTFRGGMNVWKVHFVYDSVTGITYGPSTNLDSLSGADGIVFNPNNGDLLIGEQLANKVGEIPTSGTPVVEVAASGDASDNQAFNLVVTPDRSAVLAMPNQPTHAAVTGGNAINVVPLSPSIAAGTSHVITGPDVHLTGVAFLNGKAYYGDGTDFKINGHVGILDLTTFTTTRITVVGETQGALPSHSITADSFTNGLIIGGANELWQLSLDATGTVATVVAKISLGTFGNPNNWDQTEVDGFGHLFGANNNGNLLFIDYSGGSHLISAPVFSNEQFLATALDDIANAVNLPGRM